jgi:N-acetyl-gamma-glutamyl-phosphate reductase
MRMSNILTENKELNGSSTKIRTSVIGATGYTGVELIRILSGHPQVKISQLISETYQNQEIAAVFPHLSQIVVGDFNNLNIRAIAENSDVVFLALPHTKAIPLISELLVENIKVIDLSADLRLDDGAIYEKWYQHPQACSTLLESAVYGLAEIGKREQIAKARLIANPGCYPTATILALAPLLTSKVLDLSTAPLVIDAKSGISGAGRSLNLTTHFCEAVNSFTAYQVGGVHRHIPEIEQELSKLADQQLMVQFTPHLVPMPRGLMVTIYCKLKQQTGIEKIKQLFDEYYKGCQFIRINAHARPTTKAVVGTNYCDISLTLDMRTGYLVVISTIDNLLKGASGQAVQNMNLMYGLSEHVGLEHIATYP